MADEEAPEEKPAPLSDEELAARLTEGRRLTQERYALEEEERKRRVAKEATANTVGILKSRPLTITDPITEALREQEETQRVIARQKHLHDSRVLHWNDLVEAKYRKYRNATIDTVDPDIVDQVKHWCERTDGSSLVLLGAAGLGKTWTAFAVAREFFIRSKTVRIWPVPTLLDALRPNRDENAYQVAVDCDLLVLDDLGSQRDTEWVMERLYMIINERWMAERPIVVTTNYSSVDEFRESLGERMVSRLFDGALVVRRTGADRRLKK